MLHLIVDQSKFRFTLWWSDFGGGDETENRYEKTIFSLRAIVISTCDTLMTYTALFKDGARKHKWRKNIPWNKTNSSALPSFDPTSEYPIHSSDLTEYYLCYNREFKNILSMLFSFLAMIALPCCHSILSILGSKDKPHYTESRVIPIRAIARLHCISLRHSNLLLTTSDYAKYYY